MESAREVAPRGVYKALYYVKGKAVLVAIDSKGDARKHLKIDRSDDEPRLKRALEELLDASIRFPVRSSCVTNTLGRDGLMMDHQLHPRRCGPSILRRGVGDDRHSDHDSLGIENRMVGRRITSYSACVFGRA
jgi:hypothetical protein